MYFSRQLVARFKQRRTNRSRCTCGGSLLQTDRTNPDYSLSSSPTEHVAPSPRSQWRHKGYRSGRTLWRGQNPHWEPGDDVRRCKLLHRVFPVFWCRDSRIPGEQKTLVESVHQLDLRLQFGPNETGSIFHSLQSPESCSFGHSRIFWASALSAVQIFSLASWKCW